MLRRVCIELSVSRNSALDPWFLLLGPSVKSILRFVVVILLNFQVVWFLGRNALLGVAIIHGALRSNLGGNFWSGCIDLCHLVCDGGEVEVDFSHPALD